MGFLRTLDQYLIGLARNQGVLFKQPLQRPPHFRAVVLEYDGEMPSDLLEQPVGLAQKAVGHFLSNRMGEHGKSSSAAAYDFQRFGKLSWRIL